MRLSLSQCLCLGLVNPQLIGCLLFWTLAPISSFPDLRSLPLVRFCMHVLSRRTSLWYTVVQTQGPWLSLLRVMEVRVESRNQIKTFKLIEFPPLAFIYWKRCSIWGTNCNSIKRLFNSLFVVLSSLMVGLPRWCCGKESAYRCRKCRRHTFSPWARKIPRSRKWQPTPVLLPGKSHGQRSLVGSSPWGHKD